MSKRPASSSLTMLLLCGLGLVALASAKKPLSGPITTVPSQGSSTDKLTYPYEVNCPDSSFVTGFMVTQTTAIPLEADGVHNDILIASLWPLKCSNGKSVDVDSSSELRNLGENRSFNSKRSTGYTGVTLFTGELVDAVSLQPVKTKYGGTGGGSVRDVVCPDGQVITGIYGKATDSLMISVGLKCRSKK